MVYPKVSIITVVYNAKSALQKTLDSIKQVRYPNKEVIIIDGGSTDGTKSVIEKNYLDISMWISEKDNGIYDAMNKAINIATGEFIWFMNAGDTIYDPYILESLFKGKEQFADFYYGDTLVVSATGKILGLRRKKPSKSLKWTSFKRGMTVCHQSMIIKRSIVPLYDLSYRYSSDFDWVIKILKKGAVVKNTNKIISVFETGGATTQNQSKSLEERYNIMVKYYGYADTIYHHFLFGFNVFKPGYRPFKG